LLKLKLDPKKYSEWAPGATVNLYSCGPNTRGVLGLGDIESRNLLTLVSSGWKAAVIGGFHTLALKDNGDLYACGDNRMGELGLGDLDDRHVLTFVSSGWKAVAPGQHFSLALKKNGDLYACGMGWYGALGLGDNEDRDVFTFVSAGWREIAAGYHHTLALRDNGDLYSCGGNDFGQLGQGDNTYRNTLTFVSSGWEKITAGHHSSFALAENGDLYACGANSQGELGLGSFGHPVGGYTSLVFISAGWKEVSASTHTLALKENGDLYACGHNINGALGLEDQTSRHTLTLVSSGWRAVAAGFRFTAALDTSGSLHACGLNDHGQLGLGDNSNRNILTFVSSEWKEISAGIGLMAIKAPDEGFQHCGPEWEYQALSDNTAWDYFSLYDLTFSPDGKFLFVSAYVEIWEPDFEYTSVVLVYNTITKELVYTRDLSVDAETHVENIVVKVSPDGTKLATVSGNDNHTFMLYSIASDGSLSLLGRSGFHSLWGSWPYPIWAEFDPTGAYVIAGGQQLGHTFNVSTFAGAEGFLGIPQPSTHTEIGGFSPDGQYLALGWTNAVTTIPEVCFGVWSSYYASPGMVAEYYDPDRSSFGQLQCRGIAWLPDSSQVLATFTRVNWDMKPDENFRAFAIPSGDIVVGGATEIYGKPFFQSLKITSDGLYVFVTQAQFHGDSGPLTEVYCKETWTKTRPPACVISKDIRKVAIAEGMVATIGPSFYEESGLPVQLYTYADE
jgi:alpha-tubulin suppressor-like RCC1 family protein